MARHTALTSSKNLRVGRLWLTPPITPACESGPVDPPPPVAFEDVELPQLDSASMTIAHSNQWPAQSSQQRLVLILTYTPIGSHPLAPKAGIQHTAPTRVNAPNF
jgi:hypothetical protein